MQIINSQQMAPKKVLVFDDDERWCEILTEVFNSHGVDPDVAHTADECLNLAKINKYDLIVIDVIISNETMAGISVAKELDEDPATRAVPKLFLTIVGSDVVEKEAPHRAMGVFTKPLDLPRFVEKALQILGIDKIDKGGNSNVQ